MRSNWNKILLFIGLLISLATRPQSGAGPEIWNKFGDIPDTAGIFPGEDLIILKNERVIRNGKIDDFTDYFEHDIVVKYKGMPISLDEDYMQIYVRSDRGARLTWQFQMGVPQDRTLLSIKLRNCKPNGQVIELDEADSRYVMNQTSKTQGSDGDYSYLPVPGVDAGDVIEIYSCYFVPWAVKSDEIYFHLYYPASLSSFTYEYSMDYEVSLMKYNFDRFDCRKLMPNEREITYEFYNLPGLYDQPGMLSHLDLPFIVFQIDSILFKAAYYQQYISLSSPNWDSAIVDFVKEIKDYAPNLTETSLASADNLFNRFNNRFPEASKLERAWLWHQFLSDSIAIRYLSEKEQKKPMEHWLQLRTADRSSIIAWYMYYMDYIDIDYTVYIARDIESGYLDSTFVYSGQGMSIFFGIHDGEKEHYMFPPYETETYMMDEFPSSVRGSVAIGLLAGNDNRELKIFQIPYQDRNENWKNRILHTLIANPGADRLEVDQRSYFKGASAKSSRMWYDQFRLSADPEQVLENQMLMESGGTQLLAFDIDWESKEIYHHSLSYSCENFISSHSDSTFSVWVKDISPMDIIQFPPVKRKFNFYNLQPYYNVTRYYLEFTRPVEIVGTDTVFDAFKNSFGSVRLSAYKVEENMILVETYYSADAGYLTPGNYNAIMELADRTYRMQEKRIFFRWL